MDVLHVIKDQNQKLQELIAEAEQSGPSSWAEVEKWVHAISILHMDYLFPEVQEMVPNGEIIGQTALACHRALARALKAAGKPGATDKNLKSIKDSSMQLVELVERQLMPAMRDNIPTQDREDLGQLFLDVLQDAEIGAAAPAKVRQTKS